MVTCFQMTATEQWIFLCAAHKTPKECPAIGESKNIWSKGKTKIRTWASQITLGTLWTGRPAFWTATSTSPAESPSRWTTILIWNVMIIVGQDNAMLLVISHGNSLQESSVAKLGSVCRRVYRIFSHAYFHHRWHVIKKFVTLCSKVQITLFFSIK